MSRYTSQVGARWIAREMHRLKPEAITMRSLQAADFACSLGSRLSPKSLSALAGLNLNDSTETNCGPEMVRRHATSEVDRILIGTFTPGIGLSAERVIARIRPPLRQAH